MTLVTKRLLPVYISSLFINVPLWYSIEKVFMTSIGFTTFTIGVMVAVMSLVILLIETPSGILADRWSRKGVMIIGSVCLIISAIIAGFSYSVIPFIVSTCFWGIYNALYTGTYDSVIYDTVIEETGTADQYERYLSRLRIIEGGSFVVGAISGGIVASSISLRATFFISLPLLIIGALLLLPLREPRLHKTETVVPVFEHIRRTFTAVLRNKVLLPVLIAVVGFAVVQDTIFELAQVWYLALLLPLGLYGVLSAVLFASWSSGGFISHFYKNTIIRYLGLASIVAAGIMLIISRNYIYTAAAHFVLGAGLVGFGVTLSKILHDALPSNIRAGSASVVSTIARFLIIPTSLFFGYISQRFSVFSASSILLAFLVVGVIAFISIKNINLIKQPV